MVLKEQIDCFLETINPMLDELNKLMDTILIHPCNISDPHLILYLALLDRLLSCLTTALEKIYFLICNE